MSLGFLLLLLRGLVVWVVTVEVPKIQSLIGLIKANGKRQINLIKQSLPANEMKAQVITVNIAK